MTIATPKLINGWQAAFIRMKVHLYIITEAFKLFNSPLKAVAEMRRLRRLRNQVHGTVKVTKYVRLDNRYYWNTNYCGYPSAQLQQMLRGEFLRNSVHQPGSNNHQVPLQTVIWGITNRCPLSCSHCYEWDNIAQRDRLELADLKKILTLFWAHDIRHIQFSGGEPLVRFGDLIELLREASPWADCWLLTSGFGLTSSRALELKQAGLIGVNISLDHWDARLHNQFRNNNQSFDWVIQSVRHCLKAGLMVSLSLCATRDFVSEVNLLSYAQLARDLGVQFIRILEPRSSGKFAGQRVDLDPRQVDLLSDFAIRINSDPAYRHFPIVTFFGYHQRKMGCFGAGNRYVYVDPNGDLHACPFCRGRIGNLLDEPFTSLLEKVRRVGCHQFRTRLITVNPDCISFFQTKSEKKH